MVPFVRAVIVIVMSICVTFSFYFAAKSKANSGVIASNFSSCLIFTGLFFQWVHKQRMTLREWSGSLLILASVVVISYGGKKRTNEAVLESEELSKRDLILAIVFALLTGLAFSVNSLNLKHYLDNLKFPAS